MPDLFSRILYPSRQSISLTDTADSVDAFIDSRALEYATKLEDEFVGRAVTLGVESGTILDVGTRVGLIALKLLWQNPNFIAIGVDSSAVMIDRARETAAAWELGERAFFQVGDPRRMRLKTGYFDLVVSDGVFHRFDDPSSVLAEIRRVMKPKGALLIRDFQRPNRFKMTRQLNDLSNRFGSRMKDQIESAVRAGYTESELAQLVRHSAISDAVVRSSGPAHLTIERRGATDPNSWVTVKEQYS